MNKEDTIQAILGFTEFFKGITGNQDLKIPDDMAKEYGIEQEPCEDTISRQAALAEAFEVDTKEYGRIDVVGVDAIETLPPVTSQQKMRQFAEWVASEIFDDNWEYNKDAFVEIACRKLTKLGIVRENGDEWELVEPQESEG